MGGPPGYAPAVPTSTTADAPTTARAAPRAARTGPIPTAEPGRSPSSVATAARTRTSPLTAAGPGPEGRVRTTKRGVHNVFRDSDVHFRLESWRLRTDSSP